MIKIKNRAIARALIGMLSLSVTSCSIRENNDNIVESIQESSSELSYSSENNIQDELVEQGSINASEISNEQDLTINSESIIETEPIDEIESIEDLEPIENRYTIVTYDAVTATTNVNIRLRADVKGTKIGLLKTGQSVPMIEKLNNGWYAVEYYGTVAYICGDYVEETIGFEIKDDNIGFYYTDKETNLITPDYLNNGEEMTTLIPETTCIYVYEETDDYYLCSVYNKIGYILKSDVLKMTGNYVVVDISDQTATVYENDDILLEASVITGKPETPTELGLFQVYKITQPPGRYLLHDDGTNNVWVDYMSKINGGIGFHDCTDHVHEDGFKHGWRDEEEFEDKTRYKYDGSNGCINMTQNDAMELSKILKLGDWVIVQE